MEQKQHLKDIKILMVPDVHGRDFWKESVIDVLENYHEAKVIFLGDYLDCYPFEENVSVPKTLQMFRDEIIPLKKKYDKMVTLLLGNHDCTYAWDTSICDCRADHFNFAEISSLFKENRGLFSLMEWEVINNKYFLFSHAGAKREYINSVSSSINEINMANYFNNAWLVENGTVMNSLGTYSTYRGWGGKNYGSIVWSDIREWFSDEEGPIDEGYGYQIFGHTRLGDDRIGQPIVTNYFAMIDCRETFYLDSEGNLRRYKDNEIMKPIEIAVDNK